MKSFNLLTLSILIGCLSIIPSCGGSKTKTVHIPPVMSPQNQFANGRYQENIKNWDQAFQWYEKAAVAGHIKAQYRLGILYEDGRGITQSYTEAARWYRKAANQGNTSAQVDLGVLYVKGYGVPKNYSEAYKWYKKAANQGDHMAQYNLGVLYLTGSGVAKNPADAAYYFQKSAVHGYAGAQYFLGKLYYTGNGIQRDYNQAVKWYEKAANQNYPGARDSLKKALQKRNERAMAYRATTPKYRPSKPKVSDTSQDNPWKAAGAFLGLLLKYQDWKNKNASTNSGYADAPSNSQSSSENSAYNNCRNHLIRTKRLVHCRVITNLDGGYRVTCDGKNGAFNETNIICKDAISGDFEYERLGTYWCDPQTKNYDEEYENVVRKICK